MTRKPKDRLDSGIAIITILHLKYSYSLVMSYLSSYSEIQELTHRLDITQGHISQPRADVKLPPSVSQDDNNAEPPSRFSNVLGLRRVPRRRFPLRRSATMADDVRRGVLSKFIHADEIIRASDLGPIVELETAKLTLNNDYELETDHLSDEEKRLLKLNGLRSPFFT